MATTLATTNLDTRSGPRLAAAGAASLLIHSALVALLTISGPGAFGVGSAVEVEVPEAAEAPIRPGIERSRQVTINWLGFEDPTPHSATPSEVDQAALSPEAPGVPDVPEPIELAETPVEAPAEAPTPDAESVEISEALADAPTLDLPAKAAAAEAARVLAVSAERAEAVAARAWRTIGRAAAGAQEALAEFEARVQAAAEEAATAGAPPQPSPGENPSSRPSEKQADAASRERVVDVEPGRPAAAEGLDITTVRPRWSVTTRISAVPRNPVVRIEFRRSGLVAKASFLPGQDTGHRDVDGPLLDAIYAWTARGPALDALPPEDPEATAVITMRIVLIPSPGQMRRAGSGR
jgi:hypothetical protein